MQTDKANAWLLDPVTEWMICACRVANALGHGFVELVYENVPKRCESADAAPSGGAESSSSTTA